MPTSINDGGTWRQLSNVYVNDAGTWREVIEIYVNDGGTWRLVFQSFSPITRTYNFGFNDTETVPSGATQVVIKIWGGGGGGTGAGTPGGGGGGGGYSEKTVSVTGGQTFLYTVGQRGDGSTGTAEGGLASTVLNVDLGVSMGANGGRAGSDTGTGGTAFGGDINTTGGDGAQPIGGSSPNGGSAQFTLGASGNAPGGGGAGQVVSTGGNGASGRVQFEYT